MNRHGKGLSFLLIAACSTTLIATSAAGSEIKRPAEVKAELQPKVSTTRKD